MFEKKKIKFCIFGFSFYTPNAFSFNMKIKDLMAVRNGDYFEWFMLNKYYPLILCLLKFNCQKVKYRTIYSLD